MDPSLTRTGVIATILSFIFAAAAFYVQHRKNSASKNNLSGTQEDDTPRVSTTRSGQAKEEKRQSKIREDEVEPETEPQPDPVDPEPTEAVVAPKTEATGGTKPIFKKYTTSGTQEEHPGLHNDDEALWE